MLLNVFDYVTSQEHRPNSGARKSREWRSWTLQTTAVDVQEVTMHRRGITAPQALPLDQDRAPNHEAGRRDRKDCRRGHPDRKSFPAAGPWSVHGCASGCIATEVRTDACVADAYPQAIWPPVTAPCRIRDSRHTRRHTASFPHCRRVPGPGPADIDVRSAAARLDVNLGAISSALSQDAIWDFCPCIPAC